MSDNAALVIEMNADWSRAEQGFDAAYKSFAKKAGDIAALFSNIDISGLGDKILQLNTNLASIGNNSGAKNVEIEMQNLKKATAEAETAQLKLTQAQNRGQSVTQGDSYKQLSQTYRELARDAQDYAAKMVIAGNANFTADAGFVDLQTQAKKAYDQLNTIDQSVGKYGRNVGNYASHWNGLSNAINQLTREAPAFANSIQTGLMAISNNIPILGDEIQNLTEKNKALRAEGKPTTSVLSQIGASFLSWNTLLSVGVTLLTVYGPKLWDLATSAGEAKKRAEELKKAQEELNNTYTNSLKNSAGEIANLKLLSQAAEDTNLKMSDRLAAVKKMKEEYPDLLKNYSNEDILNKNFANTLKDVLIPQLIAAAKAKAYMSQVETLAKQDIDNLNSANAAYNKLTQAQNAYNSASSTYKGNTTQGAAGMLTNLRKNIESASKNYQDAILSVAKGRVTLENTANKAQQQLEKSGNATTHALGIDSNTKTKTDAEKRSNQISSIVDKYNQDVDSLQQKLKGVNGMTFISQDQFDSDMYDLAYNAIDSLNRLHVPFDSTIMGKLWGDLGKDKQATMNDLIKNVGTIDLSPKFKKIDMSKLIIDTEKLTPKEGYTQKIAELRNSLHDMGASDIDIFSAKSMTDLINVQKGTKKINNTIEDIAKNMGINTDEWDEGLSINQKYEKLGKKIYGWEKMTTKERQKALDKQDEMVSLTKGLETQFVQLGGQIAGTFVSNLLEGKNILQGMGNIVTSLIAKFAEMAAQAALMSLISGGTGGGGVSFLSAFSSLLGGKAIGGTVNKGGLYPVNENGSELYTVGNKQYLMAGQNGVITPTKPLSVDTSSSIRNSQRQSIRVYGSIIGSGRAMKVVIDNYDNFKGR